MGSIRKRKKSNEWYGVSSIVTERGHRVWGACIDHKQLPTLCKTEREAAVMVDTLLLRAGKDPVNILKLKGVRSYE